MKLSKFKDLISTFSSRPKSGRYVYIWPYRKEGLEEKLPREITHSLDILTLAESIESSSDVTSIIQKNLSNEVIQKLRSLHHEFSLPQILMVTRCELLARYEVSIGIFFQYYVGDGTMTVFVVPEESQSISKLPSYIEFNPRVGFQYLVNFLSEQCLIEEDKHDTNESSCYR